MDIFSLAMQKMLELPYWNIKGKVLSILSNKEEQLKGIVEIEVRSC
jgi:hypothetical protein